MSGLYHSFQLVDRKSFDYSDYCKLISTQHPVKIHDNVIHYILDTLKWITSYNPATNEEMTGLSLYGPTVVRKEGAHCALRIFSAWADLFSNGPSVLDLSGPYTWKNSDPKRGNFTKVTVKRDEIVNALREVKDFLQKILDASDEIYLLHLGL